MPEIINSYEDFIDFSKTIKDSLFWIIEYKNIDEIHRYSLLRTECLQHPLDFSQRLNDGIYRIWTTIPREIPWSEEDYNSSSFYFIYIKEGME